MFDSYRYIYLCATLSSLSPRLTCVSSIQKCMNELVRVQCAWPLQSVLQVNPHIELKVIDTKTIFNRTTLQWHLLDMPKCMHRMGTAAEIGLFDAYLFTGNARRYTATYAKHFSCRLILMKFENVAPNSHIIRNKVRSFVHRPPVCSLARLNVAHTHTATELVSLFKLIGRW